ncbi:MAG: hypothetical protein ABIJ18_00775 [archaeon]
MASDDYTEVLFLEERVDKVDINLIGINHNYLVLRENREFFEEQVSGSEAVVLENFTDDNMFYTSLADLVKKREKRLFVVDPVNDTQRVQDYGQTALGGAMVCASLIPTKNLNRRELLARGALLGLGIGAVAGSTFGREALFSTLDCDRNEILGSHGLYGLLDFRNMVSAERIRALSSDLEGPILVVYGKTHVDSIANYLQNPANFLRKIAYSPYYITAMKTREL